MKKTIITLAVLAAALSGCTKQAESSTAVGVEFRVDRLFRHDGCTVYRFVDQGNNRYFVRCDGAASASTSWTESCGKGCVRDVQIPTGHVTAPDLRPKGGEPSQNPSEYGAGHQLQHLIEGRGDA